MRPDTYSVKGKVTYNGTVPEGAAVTLWSLPIDPKSQQDWQKIKPQGLVLTDGQFEISSYGTHDGAVAGDYALTVNWIPLQDRGPGHDLLGDRYSDPGKPVRKITVKKEANVLEAIELTGPPIVRETPLPE